MLLLIDNYDSFTYNLYQYLAELGADVLVRRNDEITLDAAAALAPSHLVVSPGPCTPREAGISCALIEMLGPSVPTLGVCLGHQCIGQVFGGRVVRASEPVHGKTANIQHTGVGVLRGLPSPLVATRYHSLIVERATLPPTLEVTAETDDGLIMGLRHRRFPIEGVQFHPESVLTSCGKDLLRNFLASDARPTRVRSAGASRPARAARPPMGVGVEATPVDESSASGARGVSRRVASYGAVSAQPHARLSAPAYSSTHPGSAAMAAGGFR
jgi:anthranilate synthase/aminodeoxychorismate synthase-like glutamine amidotransferase